MKRILIPALCLGASVAVLVGCEDPARKVATPVSEQGQPVPAKAAKTEMAMFGGTASRNMVNLEDKDIPEKPEPAEALWKAELGSRAYGGPTVAGSKVFIGTNNEHPRNKRDTAKNPDGEIEPIDRGNLMCFDVATGKFLWQAVYPKLEGGNVVDWPKEGICSTPLVEGSRVYYVTNRCTVACADINGFADGNQGIQTETFIDATDADIIWEVDMFKDLNVFPHNMSACSPLLVGDNLYVVTANGVDEGHINLPSPDAPSFICIDKNTGKVVWKKSYPGKNIMHGQWSNPSYAEIKGVKQVIFPGGDGWLYGLNPANGDIIWKFDCNPKNSKYELGGTGTKNDFIGTPVIYEDKVYIGVGQDPEHFTGIGHFWCIDTSKANANNVDISPKDDNFDPKAAVNANSGLVWHYGGPETRKFLPRDFVFGRTMSTACIVDGIIYIAELQGPLHCLDAKTGKKYWHYDTKGAIWGSAYYVDSKVYLTTEGGDLFVFKHSKTPKVIDSFDIQDAVDEKDFRKKEKAKRAEVEKEYLIGKVEFDAPIRSTVSVAGGMLFVMTEKNLYAFKKK